MKKVYIAGPFFTPEQLTIIQNVEAAVAAAGMEYYSPRSDGVLTDMLPEVRMQNLRKIFDMNCAKIEWCNVVLACLDFKDTGTHWEMGYAFCLKRQMAYMQKLAAEAAINIPIPEPKVLMSYISGTEKINVMLKESVDVHCQGTAELFHQLDEYSHGRPFAAGLDMREAY